MQSGENIQALHRILDLTRFISILLLLLHFYSACYPAFHSWGLTFSFLDTIIFNFSTNLFFLKGINPPKLASLVLLAVSLIGVKGRKSEKVTLPPTLFYMLIGLVLFFISTLFLRLALDEITLAELYISITTTGYLSIMAGGSRMTRLLYLKFGKDIFNENNETFHSAFVRRIPVLFSRLTGRTGLPVFFLVGLFMCGLLNAVERWRYNARVFALRNHRSLFYKMGYESMGQLPVFRGGLDAYAIHSNLYSGGIDY
jgi:hypothetical protein